MPAMTTCLSSGNQILDSAKLEAQLTDRPTSPLSTRCGAVGEMAPLANSCGGRSSWPSLLHLGLDLLVMGRCMHTRGAHPRAHAWLRAGAVAMTTNSLNPSLHRSVWHRQSPSYNLTPSSCNTLLDWMAATLHMLSVYRIWSRC
jgi:hypothetical protein